MKTMKMMMRTMRKTSQMPPAVHPQRTAVIRTRTECPPPPAPSPPWREGKGWEGKGRGCAGHAPLDQGPFMMPAVMWVSWGCGLSQHQECSSCVPPRRHGDSSSTGGETASGPHEVVSGGEWQLVHCHTSPPPPAQETFTQLDNFWCCFVFLFFFSFLLRSCVTCVLNAMFFIAFI